MMSIVDSGRGQGVNKNRMLPPTPQKTPGTSVTHTIVFGFNLKLGDLIARCVSRDLPPKCGVRWACHVVAPAVAFPLGDGRGAQESRGATQHEPLPAVGCIRRLRMPQVMSHGQL